jgi:hypothetical protein
MKPDMSDTPPATQPAPAAPTDQRPLVLLCYFLFLIACINGLTAVIGVVIDHTRRREAAGTIWQSHFNNLILVFGVFVATDRINRLASMAADFSAEFWPGCLSADGDLVFLSQDPANHSRRRRTALLGLNSRFRGVPSRTSRKKRLPASNQ